MLVAEQILLETPDFLGRGDKIVPSSGVDPIGRNSVPICAHMVKRASEVTQM